MRTLGFLSFKKMRIVFWYSAKVYQSILNNGFYNHFKPGNIISFTPSPAPINNIKSYSLFLKKDFQNSQLGKSNVRNKSEFLNKSEFKHMVSEKKKYSKKGDGKLSYAEDSSKDFCQNELAKKKSSEKNKTNKDEMKKFRMKDVICDHDLQIKIDSMFKYIEKGKKVFCDVVAARQKNQLNEVLKKLNDSKLKNYVIDTKLMPNRLCITYFQKITNTESDKVQEMETNKSS